MAWLVKFMKFMALKLHSKFHLKSFPYIRLDINYLIFLILSDHAPFVSPNSSLISTSGIMMLSVNFLKLNLKFIFTTCKFV